MIAQLQSPVLSPEEYLRWESEQDLRHEYENGEVIEVTGGTLNHNEIAVNLLTLIKNHLRGKGYRVLGSDAKLMTGSGIYYYPDVVVTCDDRDRFARDFLQYPTIIVEVLSPNTEARDRGIKQQNYMRIDTLQTYILITPEYPRVELYQRCSDLAWKYLSIAIDDLNVEKNDPLIQINSIDLTFPLSLIYENIDFPEQIVD